MSAHSECGGSLVSAACYVDEVIAYFNRDSHLAPPAPMPDDRLKRLSWIRGMYRREMECGGLADPYFIDWLHIFTPIESFAWGEIRSTGLPFWPQFPIGRFTADFADPVKKIVIECDGRAYHTDPLKDARRDDAMRADGWRVFRLPGSACVAEPMDWLDYMDEYCDGFDYKADQMIEDWMYGSAEGFFHALSVAEYGVAKHPRVSDDRIKNAISLRESVGTENKWLMNYLRIIEAA